MARIWPISVAILLIGAVLAAAAQVQPWTSQESAREALDCFYKAFPSVQLGWVLRPLGGCVQALLESTSAASAPVHKCSYKLLETRTGLLLPRAGAQAGRVPMAQRLGPGMLW